MCGLDFLRRVGFAKPGQSGNGASILNGTEPRVQLGVFVYSRFEERKTNLHCILWSEPYPSETMAAVKFGYSDKFCAARTLLVQLGTS